MSNILICCLGNGVIHKVCTWRLKWYVCTALSYGTEMMHCKTIWFCCSQQQNHCDGRWSLWIMSRRCSISQCGGTHVELQATASLFQVLPHAGWHWSGMLSLLLQLWQLTFHLPVLKFSNFGNRWHFVLPILTTCNSFNMLPFLATLIVSQF